MPSVRHTLQSCGLHSASALPPEPLQRPCRLFGCTLVTLLRVQGYGPFRRPDIILRSKHYKYSDRPGPTARRTEPNRPSASYRNALQRIAAYCNILTPLLRPTATYCNQLQPIKDLPIIPGALLFCPWEAGEGFMPSPHAAPILCKPLRTLHT